jgi:plastocyanin
VAGPVERALALDATEMRYDPDRIAVRAGDVSVVLRDIGVVLHDLRVEGRPALLVEAAPGKTATATWRLQKGRYRLYCSIPGHRAAGMEGVLEVR